MTKPVHRAFWRSQNEAHIQPAVTTKVEQAEGDAVIDNEVGTETDADADSEDSGDSKRLISFGALLSLNNVATTLDEAKPYFGFPP